MKKTMLVLRGLYGERAGLFIGGALLSAVAALSGVALLGLSGWFVTAAGLTGLSVTGLSVAAARSFDIFTPSAGIRLFALLRTGARYGERLVTHDATLAALAALRVRLFRNAAAPGAARHLLARPARLLFRLTADVDALDTLYLRVLAPAAAALLGAVALGAGFSVIRPWLGFAAAGFLLAAGVGLPLLAAAMAVKPLRRRAHGLEALRARVIDLSAGQADLLTVGRLGAACDGVTAAESRLADADDAVNRIDALTSFGFAVAGAVLLAGALFVAAALAAAGDIGAPVAALVVLAAFAALEPFAALRRGGLELGRALLAVDRIAPRLEPTPVAAPVQPPPAGTAFILDDVAVRCPASGRVLLSGVSLRVAVGERLAIVGESGAGKSTLLALLAGEASPCAGQVFAAPSAAMTQRVELFQDSVRDNLRLADPAADDARLWRALESAGLAEVIAALPGGLDARLGEGGCGLSEGQGRRLSLARLLLRDAPLWLLDEPTESLDSPTAGDLMARLAQAAAGRTLATATHIRREAAIADRLVVLAGGRIQAVWRKGEPGFAAALAALRPD